MPEEVLSFIAHKVQRNIRELEGALTRVQAFAAVHQRQVDEEEAARLLADIIPAGTRKPINVERIQALVADYYNVTLDDMKGKRRDKHIVFPRQVAKRWRPAGWWCAYHPTHVGSGWVSKW